MEKEQLEEEIKKLIDLVSPEVVANLTDKELESLRALLNNLEKEDDEKNSSDKQSKE